MKSLDILTDLILRASYIMVPGSIQPLTKMSIRDHPGIKGRSARKADNLTAICESTV
jgi:hypothetical protein